MCPESHLGIDLPEPNATGFTVGDKMGKTHRRNMRMGCFDWTNKQPIFFSPICTAWLSFRIVVCTCTFLHIKHYKQKVERNILLFIFHKRLVRLDL